MKPINDPWARLLSVARYTPSAELPAELPPGFATRVVALAFARNEERPWWGVVETFSWRALGLAASVAAASAVFNYAPARQALAVDHPIESDPVAVALEISQ